MQVIDKFQVFESGKTGPQFVENYDQVSDELKKIALKLQELLPDPAISAEERLERLSRVIKGSQLNSNFHKSARTKLNHLRNRLDELIPGNMDYVEKVVILEKLAYQQSEFKEFETMCERLQFIGDNRISDIGR